MLNLCLLTFDLYRVVHKSSGERPKALDWLTMIFPLTLMIIGYAVDTDDRETDNFNLNIVRHGFKCSIRFPSMEMEWGLLWM